MKLIYWQSGTPKGSESVILVWDRPREPVYVTILSREDAPGWILIRVDDFGSCQIGEHYPSLASALEHAARDAGLPSHSRFEWDVPDGWEMVPTAEMVRNGEFGPISMRRVVHREATIHPGASGHLGAREDS